MVRLPPTMLELAPTYRAIVTITGYATLREILRAAGRSREYAKIREALEREYPESPEGTYPNNAVIDATPDIVARYDAYLKSLADARRKVAAAEEAKAPRKGRLVKVRRASKKIPKGTQGTVIWCGPCRFSGRPRVGIKDDSGKVYWTAASNVDVIPNQD